MTDFRITMLTGAKRFEPPVYRMSTATLREAVKQELPIEFLAPKRLDETVPFGEIVTNYGKMVIA